MVQEVKSDLDKMIQKERAGGMAIKEMVKDAEPVHEIVKIVEAENIDLLIMAAHNETRIEHVIYGRINHEIVRRLPCSVLPCEGRMKKESCGVLADSTRPAGFQGNPWVWVIPLFRTEVKA